MLRLSANVSGEPVQIPLLVPVMPGNSSGMVAVPNWTFRGQQQKLVTVVLTCLSGQDHVAEMLLKPGLTGTYFQQLSTTFSDVAQCFRALIGGAGGI